MHYRWQIYFLVLAWSVSCGSKKTATSQRGIHTCPGGICQQGDFGIVDLEDTFQAGTKQKMTWEAAADAVSYQVIISETNDCTAVAQTLTDLTETEQEIVIPDEGIFYACLTATTAEEKILEAKNSRKKVVVTEAQKALLSFGQSSEIAFGERAAGSEGYALIRVVNQGSVDATEFSIATLTEPMRFRGELKAAGIYPGVRGDCETTLTPKQSCWVSLAYLPTVVGPLNTEIKMSYYDGYETVESTLTATGSAVKPALLKFTSAGDFTFPNTATNALAEHTFTLENTGGSLAVSVTSPDLVPPFAFKDDIFPGTGGTCSKTLEVGKSCAIVVEFAPGDVGLQNGDFVVSYSNGVKFETLQIQLLGTGTTP